MKKISIATICYLLCATTAFAQKTDSIRKTTFNKNAIKLNLLSLPLNNINIEYERQLTKKISVGLGLRYMPKDKIPFVNNISKLLKDDNDNWGERINSAKLGNFAISPTIRLYLGEGNLKGFYIAPFARFAKYTTTLNYPFDVDNGINLVSESINLSGDLTTITGGLLFGSQFSLSKLITLDWWVFGPQYGTSDGNITGEKSLNEYEQNALRDQLKGLDDLPIVKTNYTVDKNGVTVKIKGPWAGIRAGLSLGIKF